MVKTKHYFVRTGKEGIELPQFLSTFDEVDIVRFVLRQ